MTIRWQPARASSSAARGARSIRRARRALHLVLVAVALLGCAPLGAASGRGTAAAPRELRVLVYNVHAGKDDAGRDNLEQVAALVRESGADVVLLQELDRGTARSGGVDQPAVLARRTGLHVAFGKTLDFQGGDYGIAVLSRWPVTDHALARLPVEPAQQRAGGLYEPRGALRATIATPHGPLTVINTHLDASRTDRWRRQELRAVLALADSLRRAGTAPVLVGGDFNSTPDSEVQAEARAGGLRDAWAECGQGAGLTYPTKAAIKRIDYLYLTGSLRCTGAAVLASGASDHRPLAVQVAWP